MGDVVWFESLTVLPEDQPPDASKGIYRCASKTGDGCEGGPEGKLAHHRAKANTRLQQQNTAKANRAQNLSVPNALRTGCAVPFCHRVSAGARPPWPGPPPSHSAEECWRCAETGGIDRLYGGGGRRHGGGGQGWAGGKKQIGASDL